MRVELRFFASFREAVGQKVLEWEEEGETIPVGELLKALTAEYPDLTFFEQDGSLRGFVSILKNGRDINFLDDLETELEDGDVLSVFPPVAGGSRVTTTRSYRGISSRAAIHYLCQLGGELVDEATVVGDEWNASIEATQISVGPTLQLTEVSIQFEGEEDPMDSLIEKFSQKAMRAGG